MNENNNLNNNVNNNSQPKTTWKDVLLYVIMVVIIVIIILLMCKYCQLTKANNQHVIKPTTTAQTTTETTTIELITETTTTIPTSEAVTETTTRLTTKKTNYDVPNTPVTNTTTTRATQGTTQRPTTTTTTTTTIKKDVYTYKYQIQTSETKSFYILKNGVRMNAYILVFDNNNNPITFSNNGVGSGLTMVNSNIDLGKCPTIRFRVCNPQGLECGEIFTASC